MSSTPSTPGHLATLRTLVDEAVAATFDPTRQEVAAAGPEGRLVVDAAERAARGGKRLRALLCLAAARACGAEEPGPGSASIGAAAALELFQAAALVHDDLMDASDTRRGAPSTHRFLEITGYPDSPGAIAASGSDDRARFGESGALLVGDLLLTMSATTLHAAVLPLDRETARGALATYSAMASEVAVGQYLDLLASHAPWEADSDADLDRAERVIHAKSARYSVDLPLRLGGVLAGADADQLAWLSALGSDVGTAFQLRDDVLGVVGDPAVTGKPAGDDLREGKRTVLVALAYREADEADRELLRRGLGDADLTEDAVEELRAVLARTGALAAVEARIDALAARTAALVDSPPAGIGDVGDLRALLEAAVRRTS
ncbi:polyprenyl synthetase [Serinibacter arcticus]|uniref:Polyprenyl synthetase n=1 Tax=Serinibacter arcticus TaxID=1655435 RepID=A0A2U1ZSE4_9MICO|nr:polyprenyl synthetase family protein [Serinibacter arcticus]PWD49842.1 polyprenyl synthetase [Serinibacter arcticus]